MVVIEKGWDVLMSCVKEDVDCCMVLMGIVKELNYVKNDGIGVNVFIEYLIMIWMIEK